MHLTWQGLFISCSLRISSTKTKTEHQIVDFWSENQPNMHIWTIKWVSQNLQSTSTVSQKDAITATHMTNWGSLSNWLITLTRTETFGLVTMRWFNFPTSLQYFTKCSKNSSTIALTWQLIHHPHKNSKLSDASSAKQNIQLGCALWASSAKKSFSFPVPKLLLLPLIPANQSISNLLSRLLVKFRSPDRIFGIFEEVHLDQLSELQWTWLEHPLNASKFYSMTKNLHKN